MKNILITGISELPAWRDPAEYVYKDGKKIFAAQTNEACCKYLITEYGHIDISFDGLTSNIRSIVDRLRNVQIKLKS